MIINYYFNNINSIIVVLIVEVAVVPLVCRLSLLYLNHCTDIEKHVALQHCNENIEVLLILIDI